MPNRKLTSFAIAGAGTLGLTIIQALATAFPQSTILVLSRSNRSLPEGVKLAIVDYEDVDGVARVLETNKIEALISTTSITTSSFSVQSKLANAAKKGSVEIFLTSDFGFPTGGSNEGVFAVKSAVIDHLKSIGLPYSRIYNGSFIERLPGLAGIQTGKFNIVGKGVTPISFTALVDIAGFVAYPFTTFPLSKLRNTTFRLEGHRATMLEAAKVLGLPVEFVESVPADTPAESGFATFLQKAVDAGIGSVRWDWTERRELREDEVEGEEAKKLWTGHVWKQIEPISA